MKNDTPVAADKHGNGRAGGAVPPPSRLYWVCHLGGWTAHFLVWIPFWPIESVIALSVAAAVVTHWFRGVILRRRWHVLPPRRLVPRLLAASLATGVIMSLAAAPWLVPHVPSEFLLLMTFASLSSFTGITLGWFVIYVAYHYRERVRQAEAEKWRLEVATRDAELSAMRAQINPHFLFNSLNSLRALIEEEPVRAQRAVTDLAALLRYTLRLSRKPTTSVREELEGVRNYLALEQLRFEERLRYEIDADEASLDCQVPPLLMQTLVENGIKHGIARLPGGGVIRVETAVVGASLRIRVTNTGRLDAEPGARGVGLTTSLERLRLLFGEGAQLELGETDQEEVRVEVLVPVAASCGPEALGTATAGGDVGGATTMRDDVASPDPLATRSHS